MFRYVVSHLLAMSLIMKATRPFIVIYLTCCVPHRSLNSPDKPFSSVVSNMGVFTFFGILKKILYF